MKGAPVIHVRAAGTHLRADPQRQGSLTEKAARVMHLSAVGTVPRTRTPLAVAAGKAGRPGGWCCDGSIGRWARPASAAVVLEEAPTQITAKSKPKPKPSTPSLTVAQENAREAAESYLDFSGFSKKGLVEQLEFEGYTVKQAIYAADAVGL